jgi:hypothetical protein
MPSAHTAAGVPEPLSSAAHAPRAINVVREDAANLELVADDELSDVELESVIGGLARFYVAPTAPLPRPTV